MNSSTACLCALWLASCAGLVTFALTPLVSRLARRIGALDVPRERSLHRTPVPLLGGLAIVAGLLITVVAHLAAAAWLSTRPAFLEPVLSNFHLAVPDLHSAWGRLAVIFAGGLAIAALGVADDLYNLRVRTRLAVQFAVAIAVVSLGIRPSLGFLPQPLVHAAGILWLVGITNSFNLIDGVDALATGLAAISAALLGALMCLTHHPCTAALLFALAGACLGFLRFNWHPARVFLGSAGALFLGYMLGATTMVATFMSGGSTWLFPLLIPILVFAVPLYDTASVILIRIGLKKAIWEGDQSHFHHRLMRIGFSHRQCVVFMWLIATAFGCGGLLIARTGWLSSLVVLGQGAVLVCMIVLMERVVSRVVKNAVMPEKCEECQGYKLAAPHRLVPSSGQRSTVAM